MSKVAMFTLISLLVLAAFVGTAIIVTRDPCPREYLGYNCRGKDCDHSQIEWKRVREAKR